MNAGGKRVLFVSVTSTFEATGIQSTVRMYEAHSRGYVSLSKPYYVLSSGRQYMMS